MPDRTPARATHQDRLIAEYVALGSPAMYRAEGLTQRERARWTDYLRPVVVRISGYFDAQFPTREQALLHVEAMRRSQPELHVREVFDTRGGPVPGSSLPTFSPGWPGKWAV